ncbi:MAG: serpin family protein [Bacteroidales bacterium]|jgi:serpin B|nr:serpin family protein [Bacteroidales bacterium]
MNFLNFKNLKPCFFLFVLPLLFLACEPDDDIRKEAEPIRLKVGMEKRVAQDNEFAWDLFRQVLDNTKEANTFISPLSVSIALGMTWNGADGKTRSEMESTLKMSGISEKEINEYYQIMQNSLVKIDPSTKLNIANSIWYKDGFPIYQSFLDVNKEYFNAEVSALDFSDPKSLDKINDWCSKKTNGLIKNPLDRIPADAIMYLINAIYFKGIWSSEFNSKDTSEKDFVTSGGKTNKVDMMRQEQTFNYYEDDQAQYLDMPYGNKAFSMTVILPKQENTIESYLKDFDADEWNAITESLSPREVQVYFPKFKVQSKLELKDVLAIMGMPSAFDGEANFSRMSENDLLISRIIHSTYCDVNEKGTEAAAVTIIEMKEMALPENPVFYANRPFIFVIREKSTGVILFMGKMGEVEKY